MLDIILTAVALVLILEGVLPFLSPPLWRDMLLKLSEASNQRIRVVALAMMIAGVVIIVYIHNVPW